MKKIDKLVEQAKEAAEGGRYAVMGWAILEEDDSWTARVDVLNEGPEPGEMIKSTHESLDECLEAVDAMIEKYPPKNGKDSIPIWIDDTKQ